jgi:hypothetical protein
MAHTSSTAALPQRDFEVTVHVPHERLAAFELLMDCPGRCKSEPPCRPNSEPGMEAGSECSPAVDEFMLTA